MTRAASLDPALPSAAAPGGRGALLGWAAAFATVLIWAFWMVGTRHAVTHSLPPAAIGLLRFGVPALVLAPFWWRALARLRGSPAGRPAPLVALGLLGSGAPFFLTVATGMRYAPAAEIGALLPGTMPLFVALIGWGFLGERIAPVRVFGFALVGLGVVLIGGAGLLDLGGGAWRGHGLLLAGALQWGIYTHAYRASGLKPLEAAGCVALASVLILLPAGAPALAAAAGSGLAGPVLVQAVLQGLLSGVAGMVLYGVAIDRLGASRAAAISPLGPFLAALLAVPLLGDVPGLVAGLGLAASAAGVALASGAFAGAAKPG
jgi:drug/metabolite transporter (DMT)-like permease